MSDIQRYIEEVNKLCRSITTTGCYRPFIDELARRVFSMSEDHLKAIEEKELVIDIKVEQNRNLRNSIRELKAENKIVIEAYHNQCESLGGILDESDELEKQVVELKAEIERLKQKWISVDDRLPDCRVLIKTINCGILVAGRSIFNNGNWNWGCINDVYFEQNEVTHWQPLPT